MNRFVRLAQFPLGAAALAIACMATAEPPRLSGIDMNNVDNAVRMQDDLFHHVNGNWLKHHPIPEDKSGWGVDYEMMENILPQLREIIEAAMKDPDAKPGTEAQQIGDLYASFMDEQKAEAEGLAPLQAEFARIAALNDKKQLPELIAHYNETGVTAPYDMGVHQDNRESTKYVVDFVQSGLGLPDRDYYLKNDAKLKEVRAKYLAHIEKMLALSGDKQAKAKARQILALETELAKIQWTKVQERDPVKRYNKEDLVQLAKLTPGYDWKPYMTAAGLDGKLDYVMVSQPSFFQGMDKLLAKTPLPVWKSYFTWHVLSAYAPYLSKAYVEENFAFYGTVLNGVPQMQPRWKRGVNLTQGAIGEGLGKLYVAKYFPPENKARVEKLVANLLEAYRRSIDTLDWMGPQTKKEAQAKLAKITAKIGYPDKWRDYSAMKIVRGDLVGNVGRANEFEYWRNVNKLGKPIDRSEWDMTPQTVNAYYNPEMNEVVFPAAILQAPYFNAQADDAINYGATGATIGHELSHAFDDQGSQYDGDGNLRQWWTAEDHKKFAAKTAALVKQYSAFSPLPGYHVNGELTLGENIADNSGLAIAYKAYHLSLAGKEAPVIDGLSGNQRFYYGYGLSWCDERRDSATLVLIKSDPHAPEEFRANGAVRNQPGFYAAFGVKEGDKLYLPPGQRVTIW